MIILLGLIIGIVVGLVTTVTIPAAYAVYAAVAIMAFFDALIGGLVAQLRGRFSSLLFLSGLAINLVAAVVMALLGRQLGVDLHLVPLFAFGVRTFANLGQARRLVLRRVASGERPAAVRRSSPSSMRRPGESSAPQKRS